MHKNQQGPLRADALGAEMEGVCRDEGRAVFVPGLLPGEEGLVRIVKEQKRFAFGRLMAPPTVPSPDRREPDCPAYPRCGGCSCRHMTYGATLRAKQRHVADCFERIGHMQVNVPPVLGMEHPFAYRNKTALPVGGTAEHPQLGFFAPRSHALIPITDCPNAMPPAMDIARAFLGWMQANRIAPYVEETHTGLCRHLMIRVNRKGEAMVVVVVNGDALPHWEMLRDAITPLGAVSLILNRNTRRTNVILGPDFQLLWGRETLADILCGSVFELHPASFFQVNPMQTEVLYGLALDFAEQSAAWPDHQQQNWEAIRKVIRKEERHRRFPWKQLVAVAASIVLVFLMGISFTRSRYQGTQTEDGQIYELRGQKEEIGGGQSATASEDSGTLQELETTSYEEIVAFLGLTPPIPAWAPDGWAAEPYYAYKISEDWGFSVFYLHSDVETMLNFDCHYAADPSTMATSFPQDGEGEDVVLENGQSVYLSTNAGDTLAIWQEGNMFMYISGPITMDELVTMIYNTQGGNG